MVIHSKFTKQCGTPALLASHVTSPEMFSSYLVCAGDETKGIEKSTASVIGSRVFESFGPGNKDCCI
jgi:hypothetical protein